MISIKEYVKRLGIRRACSAFGLARAVYYRYEAKAAAVLNSAVDQPPKAKRPCSVPGRALSANEVQDVLNVLHSNEYVDQTPAEVYAGLLDKGEYLCSISTMYRLLRLNSEIKERRRQVRHPVYSKPELLATGPNQVWSWDITKLKGPIKGQPYHLYVIIDIFSRYLVGWMLAERESELLAKELIKESIIKQNIPEDQLYLHADRGSSMTSKVVAELLLELKVTKSHSRPSVSNDNPYSESQFKTIKYRPQFPERFESLEQARLICKRLIDWYNMEHYHSGISFVTPFAVHYGHAQSILNQRSTRLAVAYSSSPQRFVNKRPTVPDLPTEVYINRPDHQTKEEIRR